MGINSALLLNPGDITDAVASYGLDRFMVELIERLETSFKEFDAQSTLIPVRDGFSYSKPVMGLLEWMPILQVGDEMLMKLVGYHPENPKTNSIPTILSTFSLFDASTGTLKAILDGTLLTALRTGAASAVASRLLAKPESAEVGIVGCGAQSITQLHALSQCFRLQRVRYFDIDPGAMQSFPQRCQSFGCQVEMQPATLEQCVSEVDMLCVATSVDVGAGPVFADIPVRNHLHINAVGSDFPGKVEIPLELLRRSYVAPDCHMQAVKEGECQRLNESEIGPSITQLLQREQDAKLKETTTVFDSTGWALEDLVATQLVLEVAKSQDFGSEFEMMDVALDPRNPYEALTKHCREGMRLRVS